MNEKKIILEVRKGDERTIELPPSDSGLTLVIKDIDGTFEGEPFTVFSQGEPIVVGTLDKSYTIDPWQVKKP